MGLIRLCTAFCHCHYSTPNTLLACFDGLLLCRLAVLAVTGCSPAACCCGALRMPPRTPSSRCVPLLELLCIMHTSGSMHVAWPCGSGAKQPAVASTFSCFGCAHTSLPSAHPPSSPVACTMQRRRRSATLAATPSPPTSMLPAAGDVQPSVGWRYRGCRRLAACSLYYAKWASEQSNHQPLLHVVNQMHSLGCRHRAMVEYFAPGSWNSTRCRGGCDNCAAAAAGGSLQRDLAAEARLLLATVQVWYGRLPHNAAWGFEWSMLGCVFVPRLLPCCLGGHQQSCSCLPAAPAGDGPGHSSAGAARQQVRSCRARDWPC